MGVSKNRGYHPQIIHFTRVFHYKPSILGYTYFFGNTHIPIQTYRKTPHWEFLFDLMHTCEPNERDDRILFISFPGCSIRNPFHDSFYIPDNWAASSLIYPKTTRFRFGAVGIPIFSNFEPFYLFKARVTWLPQANCNFQMELVIGSRCKWPKIDG